MTNTDRCAAALLVFVMASAGGVAADRDTVSLRSAVIDSDLAATTQAASPATDLHLVKFPAPVSSAQRRALEDEVGRILTYLPHDAFLVRLADGATVPSLEAVGASWTAPYLADYKISPEIARTRVDDLTRRPVMIHIFPDVDLAAAVATIEQLTGARVEAATNATRFARARILLSGAEIARVSHSLAAMPEVFWLEREARKAFFNDTTIWVGQSGTAGGGATPIFDQGILGAGQVVGVLDTGIDIDSCYFRDPSQSPAMNECNGGTAINADHRKVLAVDFLWSTDCAGGIGNSEWDSHDHGTHVAGTVAGDDLAQPGQHNGRDGMAPQAKLVIQDCGYEYNPRRLPGHRLPAPTSTTTSTCRSPVLTVHSSATSSPAASPPPAAARTGSTPWRTFSFRLRLLACGRSLSRHSPCPTARSPLPWSPPATSSHLPPICG